VHGLGTDDTPGHREGEGDWQGLLAKTTGTRALDAANLPVPVVAVKRTRGLRRNETLPTNIPNPGPRPSTRLGALVAGVASAMLAVAEAPAQTAGGVWPARPVRLIVPNAPGGLADITARLVGTRLGEALGQPMIVDNRPGAGGTIGTGAAVKAAADGYTLLAVFDSHATNPHLFRNIAYDTVNDLASVSLLVRGPVTLVVHPGVPAKSVKDLLALARAKPGMLNVAIVGPGSPARLLAELLELTAKIEVTQVPYKGASGALADLIGGQVDAMFATVPSISGHWKAGKLRALAVTSGKRSPALPGVPTMTESLPGFEAETWVALLAPAKTPPEIIARVNAEVVKVLAQPEMRERLGELGLEAAGSTPAQADKWIRTQVERWGRVIREQKIVIE
jgi:tripartite-type tricarboxylate transporter receptor subunit TctC